MIRVAAIQMTSAGELATNLQRAQILVAQAADNGAKLVVLPENFAYYGIKNLADAARQESTPAGPVRHFLAELANKYGVWLVGGTVPIASPGAEKGYATCLLYNPQGEEATRYDKIHLFDVDVGDAHNRYRESDDYQAGSKPVVVETPFGRLGLSVCYDLRFAELYRRLADQGAEIVAVPSAFTAKTGAAHWQVLLRSRAIENQCFMVGANMGDRDHPKRPTWGGSAIVHPWGDVLAELEGGEGVICANLEVSDIKKLKKNMPIDAHRKL